MLVETTIAFIVCIVNVSAQTCKTVSTPRGTQWPEPCVFPFTFKGKTYHSCTQEHDPDGKFWCSVQVDATGAHMRGSRRFGHCDQACFAPRPRARPPPAFSGNAVVPDVRTSGGPTPGVKCVFPFRFRSEWHTSCIPDEEDPSKTWCSTKVDKTGKHVKGHWGFCEDSRDAQEVSTSIVDFKCGVVEPLYPPIVTRIVNGSDTFVQEYPFAALIAFRSDDQPVQFGCGGALIHPRYVLTAAHCLSPHQPAFVRLGEHDVSSNPDCVAANMCAPSHQDIDIEESISHPEYRTSKNDIGLIKLVQPARLNEAVQIACLPGPSIDFSISDLVGRDTTIIGWGRTEWHSAGDVGTVGASSSILQHVTVPVVNRQACQLAYRQTRIDDSVICAGMDGRDSCRGDSGGPLLYRIDEERPWTLIGVVSLGDRRCGSGRPALYSSVEFFLDWIHSAMVE